MNRLSFKSINAVVSFWIGIVIVAGVTLFIAYVAHSSYTNTFNISVESMTTLDKSMITGVNDKIDSCLRSLSPKHFPGVGRHGLIAAFRALSTP